VSRNTIALPKYFRFTCLAIFTFNPILPHPTCSSLACGDECSLQAIGTLPPELGDMDTVTTFIIGGNRFHGPVPPEWGAAGKFPMLQSL
jgi:hypothetical protein